MYKACSVWLRQTAQISDHFTLELLWMRHEYMLRNYFSWANEPTTGSGGGIPKGFRPRYWPEGCQNSVASGTFSFGRPPISIAAALSSSASAEPFSSPPLKWNARVLLAPTHLKNAAEGNFLFFQILAQQSLPGMVVLAHTHTGYCTYCHGMWADYDKPHALPSLRFCPRQPDPVHCDGPLLRFTVLHFSCVHHTSLA